MKSEMLFYVLWRSLREVGWEIVKLWAGMTSVVELLEALAGWDRSVCTARRSAGMEEVDTSPVSVSGILARTQ